MSNITLVIIPGPGAQTLEITPGLTTLSDIVTQRSLQNRDLIVNGASIPSSQWSTFTLDHHSEVFATASVKGNVKNGPSTTGRPSGGGRGNNSPKGK